MAEVLEEELKSLGLDSLTGGGAEIFQQEVRDRIARGKETAEEYLDVHRSIGWGGTAPVRCCSAISETMADRVDHMRQLRELQDETGGFTGFIPLPYQPENNKIPVQASAHWF